MILNAKEMRTASTAAYSAEKRQESFVRLQRDAIKNKDTEMHLHFREFGFDWTDVQWILDLGFKISRNGACQRWEVLCIQMES